mmetsp:Transcript_49471/g.115712  ORF Transcript_49471/g.115712 Transcript_49471/m.115712 type:complete len:873 (+) Transcript_49471:116-2734(+)
MAAYYARKTRTKRLKYYCSWILERISFQAVMFALTVYALIGEDIRVAATHRPADVVFNIVTIIALVLFSFELVANVLAKDDYFLGFFFWLDLIATASLILDITWVYDAVTGMGNEDSSIARAGRMSRVGTRAGRVLRVIRLIRLIRIIKLYKHMLDVRQRMQGKGGEGVQPGQEGLDDDVLGAESRVGTRLSQLTTQKVIILILCMLIILPNIKLDVWFSELPASSQYGADVVNRAWMRCNYSVPVTCEPFEQQLMMYISYHHRRKVTNCDHWFSEAFSDCRLDLAWLGRLSDRETDRPPFQGFEYLNFEDHWERVYRYETRERGRLPDRLMEQLNSPWQARSCDDADYFELLREPVGCPLQELRTEELFFVAPTLVDTAFRPAWVFIFDLRPFTLRSAVYNMIQTVFICFMLAIGAWLFSKDAHELVLVPIERMVSKVQRIKETPLYAMKLGDDQYRQQQEEENKKTDEKQALTSLRKCWRRQKVTKNTLETQILENAIIKLGKLLALGFGEAGSEIIGKNMIEDSATVNAMIQGSRVEAVFGQCDIQNFTHTTEVLQDKVMVFVNQVAEIVHRIVDSYHGAANRNIGDAFLMVWRMRDESQDSDTAMRSKMADMSAISMVAIMAAVSKSVVLKEYREHPGLLARISNYHVRLGFGLHYGWAIEGAIGSEFKIDASYISPHVNVASRLASASKAYQVGMIMSQPLVQLCSKEMASFFRTIDHVTLKGTWKPLKLHTIDLYAECLHREVEEQMQLSRKPMNPFELRMQRDKAKEEKLQQSFKVHKLFSSEPDIRMMRRDFPRKFFDLFMKGYLNYEAGEWDVARVVLEQTRTMLGRIDGPSRTLLDFMAGFEFESSHVPPKGWPGHRELPEL